jgi:two-component system response regulator GlrR
MTNTRPLLVIGPEDFVSALRITSLISSTGHIKTIHVNWSDFAPECLADPTARMVVIFAAYANHAVDQLFSWLRAHPISMPTLAILPENAPLDKLQDAADAVDDFVTWPLPPLEFELRLRRMLGQASPDIEVIRSHLNLDAGMAQIVGEDPGLLKAINQIPLMATTEAPVLITGETGVGKELCARTIHHLGARRNGPFIPADCGALPESLLENELFGHSRGAFTGALTNQKGLVAMAQHGTLFIDEIDSLSLTAQTKLLRLLQERAYRPLGAEEFSTSNARVIAASNRNLEEYLKDGKFRMDLFYRLDVLRLHIPPLRERKDDIALLARRYLLSLATEQNQPHKRLSLAAIRKLERHEWPGNVRELLNVLQRSAVLSSGRELGPNEISLPQAKHNEAADTLTPFRSARTCAIERFETAYVTAALRRHGGNVTRAAMEAGKERRSFGKLVQKYKIDKNQLR